MIKDLFSLWTGKEALKVIGQFDDVSDDVSPAFSSDDEDDELPEEKEEEALPEEEIEEDLEEEI